MSRLVLPQPYAKNGTKIPSEYFEKAPTDSATKHQDKPPAWQQEPEWTDRISRIAKYIPGEVLALYVTGTSLIAAGSHEANATSAASGSGEPSPAGAIRVPQSSHGNKASPESSPDGLSVFCAVSLWIFCLVLTWLWVRKLAKQEPNAPTHDQVVWNQAAGCAAFAVWSYAYPEGLWKLIDLHVPMVAGLLILCFSACCAYADPPPFKPTAVADPQNQPNHPPQSDPVTSSFAGSTDDSAGNEVERKD